MNLSRYIQELLLAHDCVILPDFGAFVANYRPAYIDETRKLIYPPGKNLSFNRNLTHNDGLLIGQIAKSTDKGYNETAEDVKSMLATWSKNLRDGGRIEITDVGIIFGGPDGQPHFIPDQSANLIGAAFGMEPMRLVSRELGMKSQEERVGKKEEAGSNPRVRPSVKQPEKVEKKQEKKPEPAPRLRSVTAEAGEQSAVSRKAETQNEDRKPQTANGTPDTAHRSRRPYYIAAACLLPIAFYSYWIPVHTDAITTGELSLTDFNPFSATSTEEIETSTYEVREGEFELAVHDEKMISYEEALAQMAENETLVTIPLTDEISIKVKVKADGSLHEKTDNNAERSFGDTDSGLSGYYVIGGAYSVESNAHDKVKELSEQGYTPQIVDIHNGLHRVSYKRFDSRSAAKDLVDSIEASGGSAWVLKK